MNVQGLSKELFACALLMHVQEQPIPDLITTDLVELLRHINSYIFLKESPGIFDMKGREVWCPRGVIWLNLYASNVTIQNGTIWLSKKHSVDGPVLLIEGTGVTLLNMQIHGGQRGLSIRPGGSVVMRNCKLMNAVKYGLQVGQGLDDPGSRLPRGTHANLLAQNLEISGSLGRGLSIGLFGVVQLSNCVVTDCGKTGVEVSGHLIAWELQVLWSGDYGLMCSGSGCAVLKCCTLSNRPTGAHAQYPELMAILSPRGHAPLGVGSDTCEVELWYCTLSGEPELWGGGAYSNEKLVSMPLLASFNGVSTHIWDVLVQHNFHLLPSCT